MRGQQRNGFAFLQNTLNLLSPSCVSHLKKAKNQHCDIIDNSCEIMAPSDFVPYFV